VKKVFPAILVLLVVVIIAVPIFFTKVSAPRKDLPLSSGYWVVNVADNKTLTHTSVKLNVGDQYIATDNKIYRITKIVKDKVYVEQIE